MKEQTGCFFPGERSGGRRVENGGRGRGVDSSAPGALVTLVLQLSSRGAARNLVYCEPSTMAMSTTCGGSSSQLGVT